MGGYLMDRLFLDNGERPIKCKANAFVRRLPNTIFFSDKLNKKYDEKRKTWDKQWAESLIMTCGPDIIRSRY